MSNKPSSSQKHQKKDAMTRPDETSQARRVNTERHSREDLRAELSLKQHKRMNANQETSSKQAKKKGQEKLRGQVENERTSPSIGRNHSPDSDETSRGRKEAKSKKTRKKGDNRDSRLRRNSPPLEEMPLEDAAPESSNEFLIISARTPSDGQRLGIAIRQINERLYISDVKPDSAFKDTGLTVCQKIVSINQVDCSANTTVESALKLLRSTKSAITRMTVQQADPSMAVVFNPDKSWTITSKFDPNESIGVTFKEVNGRIYIHSVDPFGAFGRTAMLRVGYEILEINSRRPISCSDALLLAKLTPGSVSMTVKEMRVIRAVATATPLNSMANRPPPPGVPAGGVWGHGEYCGPESVCAIFLLMCAGSFFIPLCFGTCLVPLVCPCDTGIFYQLNGKYYSEDGYLVGTRVRGFRLRP